MSKSKGFFWSKATGLKADIKRHREKEQELRDKIEELEKEGDSIFLRTYREFLNKLLDSKAEVVSQIGKKK